MVKALVRASSIPSSQEREIQQAAQKAQYMPLQSGGPGSGQLPSAQEMLRRREILAHCLRGVKGHLARGLRVNPEEIPHFPLAAVGMGCLKAVPNAPSFSSWSVSWQLRCPAL